MIYLLVEYINLLLNILVYKNNGIMSSDRETCIMCLYEFQTDVLKPVITSFTENDVHSNG
jgi:hypothetical protein